jgi:hypothetical protein
VRAAFTVTRIRDVDAEQRMRTIAEQSVAVRARGQVSSQLVTAGADPARAHTVDPTARHEATAIYARQEYLAYLEGKCNARPGQRALERVEARLTADADLAQARDQAALHARATLRLQLLSLGAKERPPMPAPIAETPGPAPEPDAEWAPGYWSWESSEWEWQAGGWSSDDDLIAAGHPIETGTRDHRKIRDRVRDHRDLDDPPVWRSLGKDTKRDEKRDDQTTDHRNSRQEHWTPSAVDTGARVRDHRDEKKDDKKDDDKPLIRDHR